MDIQAAQSVVLETLQRATSQDADVLRPAEHKLKEWETEPGFYTILLNIFSNHSYDVHVRWLAAVYFKNGIDKYWRKTAPNAISESEKASLREGLVGNFREPVNQIATQIAVLISKAARFDCPREWPQLIPTVLSCVKSDDHVVQHRSLLTMHHVIKTLSSKRLAGDRRLFQELTDNIFTFVLNMWNALTESFLQKASQNASDVAEALEKSLLSLRVLRKLVVYGFKKPHECDDAVIFVQMVFDRAKTMLACRKSFQNNSSLRELLDKKCILLTKVLLDLLEHHPFSYIQFIVPSLEFSVYYAFSAEGEPVTFERFVIQCLNLMKAILLCVEYKPNKVAEALKEPASLEAHRLKVGFFSRDLLTAICRKLVSHYFLLTTDDLTLWDCDPEAFATDEGGESWKYSIRPCTESLFLSLFREFREIFIPVILEMIACNHDLVPASDLQAILRKDAVYNAVGQAAFELYDEVNFDQWFSSTLLQELRVTDPNYRIVRRRVIWMVGRWTGVKMSQELRPFLYEAILPLLSLDEDVVVRLTAAETLKMSVDDFEFDTDQFLPYLQQMFGSLFALLKEANECDTKMHVLNVLSFIIERVNAAIRPHASALIGYLPLLWQESENHNMLRCAILTTLVNLVLALGSSCQSLSPFLLPTIKLSTDKTQPCHVYLMEEGLDLWLVYLENTTQMTPDLLDLFRNLPPLVEYSTENLKSCMHIVKAYVLLAPEQFLKTYGLDVVTTCNGAMSDMRSEGIVVVMRMIETMLRACPSYAVQIGKPIFLRAFQSVYKGEDLPILMSIHLSILSRILLCSQSVFSEVLSGLSQLYGKSQDAVLAQLLDVWLDKMAIVTQLERRKLLGLALSLLLTSQSGVVLERFCGMLLNISEVLNDIMKTDDLGAQIDSLIVTDVQQAQPSETEEGDFYYETEHEQRKKKLNLIDPVHTTVLKDYFQSQINALRAQVGPLQFEQLIQTVDVETLAQARDYANV